MESVFNGTMHSHYQIGEAEPGMGCSLGLGDEYQ